MSVRTRSNVRIAECNYGQGVICTEPIPTGTKVFDLEGSELRTPIIHSIQIAPDLHLDPHDAIWRFVNHHCAPNLRVALRDRAMIALRDINVGEELFFNYLSTEWDMRAPFVCNCSAPYCPGMIAGLRYLSSEQRWPIRTLLSDAMRQQLEYVGAGPP